MKFINQKVIVLLALCIGHSFAFAGTIKIGRLTCENTEHPMCVGAAAPLFGWQCTSDIRGDWQTAYQIMVSDHKEDMETDKGNVWNSGLIKSDQSDNIVYKGKKLRSATRYYWKVRIWNSKGEPSAWSEIARFETGLLNEKDWKARWIGDGSVSPAKEEDFYEDDPAPIFRKTCRVEKAVASARLYITGLGYYEASINGRKVSDRVLAPGWTDYKQTVLYDGYDVTDWLATGENVIRVMVGNGYYNPLPLRIFKPIREVLTVGRPKVIAQLTIKYSDGKEETVATDTSWKTLPGPVMRNSVYLGERYDARQDVADIDSPAYDDSRLKNAVISTSPGGLLTANPLPPIRETATLNAVRMTEAHPGVFVYDFGQNFAGVVRLKVRAPRGTVIRLRYGEDVYSDGSLNGMTSVAGQLKKVWGADRSAAGQPQTAYQEDVYIAKGEGEEAYQPRFTFHGFRYVEVTGYPGRPELGTVEGVRLSSDFRRDGAFECSDELLNRISTAVDWTFLSNVFSVQSDCPHREKLGYGGDLAATLDSYMYKFDMNNFYQHTVRNFREARRPSGAMTETAPFVGIADHGFGDGSGPIGWQLGFGLTIGKLYAYYGNRRLIAENYDVFKAQVEFLRSNAEKNLMSGEHCLGDHEALAYGTFDNGDFEVRCVPVSATAHYYEHVRLLASFAELLNKKDDCKIYGKLAEDIKTAFIEEYVAEDGTVGNGSQSAQCFALYHGLYPEEKEVEVFHQLVHSIAKADDHIHTGFFGTQMILLLLSKYGRSDLAYSLATHKTFPGWGYMLEHGATTIWETWHYSDDVYSQNHPMFGTISEWFYRTILGINGTAPGFKTIRIRPVIPDALTWAKGYYDCIKGKISVDWKKTDNEFTMDVTVPFGVEAEICLPNAKNGRVTEDNPDTLSAATYENGYAVVHVLSGNYHFSVTP